LGRDRVFLNKECNQEGLASLQPVSYRSACTWACSMTVDQHTTTKRAHHRTAYVYWMERAHHSTTLTHVLQIQGRRTGGMWKCLRALFKVPAVGLILFISLHPAHPGGHQPSYSTCKSCTATSRWFTTPSCCLP
jgi:hypothetical protein